MRPMACESDETIDSTPRSCSTFSRGLRLGTHAALGEGHVGRNLGIEVVAHHDHVEELGLRVDAERRVGLVDDGT